MPALVSILPSSRIPCSPLRLEANSRTTALWASSGNTKDHEDLKRMAKNRSYPCTHDLIQSGQRQVKTPIGRQNVYMLQFLQDWNTFRWSRILLLGDPAANFIRMKVHVFSDPTLRLGVSNPDPPNYWTTQLEDVWQEHGFVEICNLVAREVQLT